MNSSALLLREAEESLQTGQWDLAIEKLEALRESAERPAEVFPKLARANAIRGRFSTVLSLYLEWAQSALQRDDLLQAEEALGYARALRPHSTEVHEMSLRLARAQGKVEDLCSRLLELAHLYLEQGVAEQCLHFAEEAVKSDPSDIGLPLRLAEIHVSLGQISTGLRLYEEFVERHRDSGKPELLLEPLRRLRILRADQVESLLLLGQVCLALGRVDEAEEQFRTVLKLDLENQEALLELATVCKLKGLFRNGLLALQRVLQLAPKTPLAHRRAAEIHLASGDPESALDSLREAAQLIQESSDSKALEEVYRAILEINHRDPLALDGLRALGLSEEAERVLSISPIPEPESLLSATTPDPEAESTEIEVSPVRPERFKRRPDLVRKSDSASGGARPIFHRSGSPRGATRRPGLGPAKELSESPIAAEKPILPERLIELPDSTPVLLQKEPISEAPEKILVSFEEVFAPTVEQSEGGHANREEPFEFESLFDFDSAELFEEYGSEVLEPERQDLEAALVAEPEPAPEELEASLVEEPEPEHLGWTAFEEPQTEEAEGWLLEELEPELDEPEVEDAAILLLEQLDPTNGQEPLLEQWERPLEPAPAECVGELFPESLDEGDLASVEESQQAMTLFDFDDIWQELDMLERVVEQSVESEVQAEEAPSLDYGELVAVEISRVVEIELEESPEISMLLASTIPTEVSAPEGVISEAPLESELPQSYGEEALFPAATPMGVAEPPEPLSARSRIEQVREHLALYPTDETELRKLADLCLRYGMMEEALLHYRRLQELHPASPELRSRIVKAALWLEDMTVVREELWKGANLSFELGDLAACREHLGDLIALDAEHGEARRLLVEVFLASGEEKLAAWHLSQMVERRVADSDLESAVECLRRLYQITPTEAVLERLGQLYEQMEKDSEAVEIFRELRENYAQAEETRDALRLAYRVVSLATDSVSDREILISLLQESGEHEKAIQEMLALAEQVPDKERAVYYLQKVLAARPEALDAERLLVEIYLRGGELERAEAHAESLAERFLAEKEYAKAVHLYQKWVDAAPTSARARERLAQFYQLHGDLDRAKLEWLLVTDTHCSAGDYKRAVRSLERALELEPEQHEWRLKLAQIRAGKLGQIEQALFDLRLLFRILPEWKASTVVYLDTLIEHGRMTELGETLGVLEGTPQGTELKLRTLGAVQSRMSKSPEDKDLAFGWGELCLGLGALDQAIEQFQKLRRYPEYRLHCYRMLGLAFSLKSGINMIELALSQFRKGLALEEGVSTDRLALRYDMACALARHDRKQEALEQFQACLLEDPLYRDVEERIALLGL